MSKVVFLVAFLAGFAARVSAQCTYTPQPSITICPGSQTIVFSGSPGISYPWTNSSNTTGLGMSGSGNISFNAINNTAAPISSVVTVRPTKPGCTLAQYTFTITVQPKPVMNAVPSQFVCNGATTTAISFSGTPAGTVFNWVNNQPSMGLASSGSGPIAPFTVINPTTVSRLASITVTPVANGCVGAPAGFRITALPTPTVNPISNIAVCAGSIAGPVNFSGTVSGTTFSWTGTHPTIGMANLGTGNIGAFTALNPSPVLTAINTITVTPVANGCSGTARVFAITVKPRPRADSLPNAVICAGATMPAISFTGPTPGSTYSWTNSNTTIGLPASGTGTIPSFVATNSTSANTTATITYTALANGCAGTAQTFTIIVVPGLATSTSLPSLSYCEVAGPGSPANVPAITLNGLANSYSWTNSNTNIGLAASGTGVIPAFAADNPGVTDIVATITVTPSNATGCSGVRTYQITVHPLPSMDIVSDQTICSGSATTAVMFAGSLAGTTYDWTNTLVTPQVPASGTGNIASFTGVNNGTSDLVYHFVVTPRLSGCSGSSTAFNITVKPPVTVAGPNTPFTTVCDGRSINAFVFTSAVSGVTYSWTNDNTNINLAASGVGDIAGFVAQNTGASPEIAHVAVTPSLGGCSGPARIYTITVNPTPVITPPSDAFYCAGNTLFAIPFNSSVPNSIIYWSRTAAMIGLPATNGMGNLPSFQATNTGTTPLASTFTIIARAGGCVSAPQTFTITVNPRPVLTIAPVQEFCPATLATPVSFQSNVPGSIFFWNNSNTAIGLGASGTGQIGPFTTVNATQAYAGAVVDVTARFTFGGRTCSSNTAFISIAIKPTPTVNSIADQASCPGQFSTPVSISGSIANAVYSWTVAPVLTGLVASGTGSIPSFTPSATGNQSAVVTVTPNFLGCDGPPISFNWNILTAGTAVISGGSFCNSGTTQLVVTSGLSGGTFSGPAGLIISSSGLIDLAASTIGTYTVSYQVASAGGCTGSATSNITISQPVVASISGGSFCATGTQQLNVLSGPSGGTYTAGPGLVISSSGLINAATSTPGIYTVSYAIPGGSCSGLATTQVTIQALPVVNAVSAQSLCNATATAPINFSGGPAGTVYNWVSSGASIGLASSGTGNIPSFTTNYIDYGVSGVSHITVQPVFNGCTGTGQQFDILVYPTPTATVVHQVVCTNTSTYTEVFGPSVPGTTYSWVNDNTSTGIPASGTGTMMVPYPVVNNSNVDQVSVLTVTPVANGCIGPDSYFSITVTLRLTAIQVPDMVVCSGTLIPAVQFGGMAPSYTWYNSAGSFAEPSLTLPHSGLDIVPAFVATNSGTTMLQQTFFVMPTTIPQGTCFSVMSYQIMVLPVPAVDPVASQAICAGNSTAPVAFTGSLPGTTYIWTNDNLGTGLYATGVNSFASFIGRNNTGTTQVSNITVTPTLGGCDGAPALFTITVHPSVSSISYNGSPFCPVGNVSPILVGSQGGIYTASPAGLSINPATGVVNLTASAPGSYTIQYSVSPGGGCPSTASTTIVVKAEPTMVIQPNQLWCRNDAVPPLAFSGTATSYSWTNDNTLIGLGASGSGSIPGFTAATTLGASASQYGTIHVFFNGNGCAGHTQSFRITVNACGIPARYRPGNREVVQPVTKLITDAWPNPTQSLLHVACPVEKGMVEIRLLDTKGRVLRRQRMVAAPELLIDISTFKSGTYLLQLTGEVSGILTQVKVVKL